MAEKFTITVMADPMVYRYLEGNAQQKDGALDLAATPWYGLVTSMLCRKAMKIPSKVSKRARKNWRPMRIWITESDFYRYGYETNEYQEQKFNSLMRRIIKDEVLRRTAILRSCMEVPVRTAIDYYTISYGFSEEEMNPESMRKEYNRKFAEIEREYRAFAKETAQETGREYRLAPPGNENPAPSATVYRKRKRYPRRRKKAAKGQLELF